MATTTIEATFTQRSMTAHWIACEAIQSQLQALWKLRAGWTVSVQLTVPEHYGTTPIPIGMMRVALQYCGPDMSLPDLLDDRYLMLADLPLGEIPTPWRAAEAFGVECWLRASTYDPRISCFY